MILKDKYEVRKFILQYVLPIVKLLALALTNLVLELANLVTNLVKPSLG